VIHCLVPLMTHESPFLSAVVLMFGESDPIPDRVRDRIGFSEHEHDGREERGFVGHQWN
jgi:hypothetical protein